MGTWSIDNGASITQNGLVTIPSLASGSKTYTVTYKSSDDGCTCTHLITQTEQAECSCTGYGVTASTSSSGSKIGPYNDGMEYNAGTVAFGTCPTYVLPRFEFIEGSGVDFAYLYVYNNNNTIVCTVKRENYGSARSAQYRVYFGPTPNKEECSVILTVWQAGTSPTPTECTSWGDWGDWQTATVGCSGGDSSAEVCRYRTCLTDPTKTESDCETVYFSTTSCNTGGTITVYNQNGKKVEQSGGCSCGGGGCSDATVTLSGLDGNAEVTINGSSYYWGNGSHTYSFPSGTNSVSISVYKSGCSFSPSSGTLTCGGSFSTTATCGGGGGCSCSLAESSASFTSAGGSKSITVNGASSCSGWQATSSQSWCTASYSSGSLNITVEEYTSTTADRSATVTLKTDSGNVTCGTVSVSQSKKSGSCTINYTSTGNTGHASFSYGGSTKTSSSGSFTASGTGGTITASADSGYYVQPSSADIACGGSQRFDIFKDVACTVYGSNTGTSVSIDYHPNNAPSATVTFSIDYDMNGTKHTWTEYGKTISAASGGKNNFTVSLPSGGVAIDSSLKIVSQSFTNSLDYNTWEHYIW